MAMIKTYPLVGKLVAKGEAQVGKAVTRLLSSDRFASMLQGAVQRALTAKGFMDKNLRIALSAMNLPSTRDVRALQNRLDDLERILTSVDQKVDELVEARPSVPQAQA